MFRNLVAATLLAILSVRVSAQPPAHPNVTAHRAAMAQLDRMVGQWEGTAWYETAPGNRQTLTQTEVIEKRLDGLVLLIEGVGIGKLPDGAGSYKFHHALGTIAYDSVTKGLRVRAYTASGLYVDADAKFSDGIFEWTFKDPRVGIIRYTEIVDASEKWTGIGERSADGKTWTKFYEAKLERKRDGIITKSDK